MNSSPNAHTFAFYLDTLTSILSQPRKEELHVFDADLVYRIGSILRLERDDSIILFDRIQHVFARLISVESKKSITIHIHEIAPNKHLTPAIHWLMPLLKREAFEESLYALTELGAQTIQPVLTQKTTRFFGGDKEIQRYQKIIKAAAEQSKQFVLPELLPIVSLDIALSKLQYTNAMNIFFDPAGRPLREVVDRFEQQKKTQIVALNGPEGDLTVEEKVMISGQGFVFCALSQTVLRAQQAVAVGLGSLRSLLH